MRCIKRDDARDLFGTGAAKLANNESWRAALIARER
jgi:hypothetical protein